MYDANDYRPMLLPWCGHNICLDCSDGLHGRRTLLTCKVCNQTGDYCRVTSVTNYALVDLVEILAKLEQQRKEEIEVSYSRTLSDISAQYQEYPRPDRSFLR